MRNKLLLCFVMLLNLNANAFWGDEVGNGAGLIENRIINIYHNIDRYIAAALEHGDFRDSEIEDLSKILIHWSTIENETIVQFSEDQSFFEIDGDVKIAVTGLELDSPIFLNSTLINTLEASEYYEAMVSVLVHELGHKVGILDHNYLDALGSKVSRSTLKSQQFYFLDILNRENFVEVVSFHSSDLSDKIILNLEGQTYNISEYIDEQGVCNGTYEAFNFHTDPSTQNFSGLILFNCEASFEVRTFVINNHNNKVGDNFQLL